MLSRNIDHRFFHDDCYLSFDPYARSSRKSNILKIEDGYFALFGFDKKDIFFVAIKEGGFKIILCKGLILIKEVEMTCFGSKNVVDKISIQCGSNIVYVKCRIIVL